MKADDPVVELSNVELLVAASVGNMRRVKSKNLNDKKHSQSSDWGIDTIGAIAEMAVAKYLGVYWEPTVNTFKAADVAGLQVRASQLENACLIVRPNDMENDKYVLVIVGDNHCRIAGWFYGYSARFDLYWRGDAWWVPQEDLKRLVKE